MSTNTSYPQVTLENIFQPVLAALTQLVSQLDKRGNGVINFPVLKSLLETLPMASNEFGLASNRLANSNLYVEAQEFGAAKWELKSLKLQLLSVANAPTKEPHRRLLKTRAVQLIGQAANLENE